MSGGKSSGRQTLAETREPLLSKLESAPSPESAQSSNRPGAPSKELELPLLVLASTFPKGSEDSTPAFVLDLSRHLQSRFQVTVLAPAVKGAPEKDEIDGVQVRRFRYFWPRSLELLADGAILENVRRRRWLLLLAPFLVLFEFIAAFRWARTNRPAVIQAHWFVPQGLVGVIVGGLLRIPVVVTSHGADTYGLRGRSWTFIRKAIAGRSAAVTVVSQDIAAKLPGLTSRTGEPPKVMPMGVDTDIFHPSRRDEALRQQLSAGGPLILFVGRLAEKKGVRYLLRAMPDVLRRFPNCALVIVGDGPLRGQLEALADQLNIQGNVTFVGGVSHEELPAYYASGDVFVGPSVVTQGGDTEAFGVVFAEAMAAAIPIVATAVGGVADIVVPGRTGLLVEPESPEDLAKGISRLLDSLAEARRMGTLARRWVRRKFDWPNVAAGYGALLTAVIQSTGSASLGKAIAASENHMP
jgi:glycosyltransferase involved in cell wall biosynthesis